MSFKEEAGELHRKCIPYALPDIPLNFMLDAAPQDRGHALNVLLKRA